MNFVSKLVNVSLTRKLLVSNAAYAIPIVILMVLMIKATNVNIDFGQWEMYGNVMQRPLEKAMQKVSEHKLAALRALAGDETSRLTLVSIESAMEDALNEMDKADNEVGEALQFTDEGLRARKRDHFRVSNVRQEWAQLKATLPSLSAADVADKHTHLIADLRTMITHSGDTSNLILDPDLDSYYMMDITLLALPQTQDRVQEVLAYVEPIIRRGSPATDAERTQISVYAAMLQQADHDRIIADVQTVVQEDPNFYGVSPTLKDKMTAGSKDFTDAYAHFIDLTKKIGLGNSVAPDKYVAAGTKALDVSYGFWQTCVDELDNFLSIRLGIFRMNRFMSIVFGTLALMGAMLLGLLIGRSLKGSIGRMGVALTGLQKATDATNTTGTELVDMSQQLSTSTTEQAAAIQETVSTINEINAMVTKSVDNAEKSANRAATSQSEVNRGQQAMHEMVDAIGEISRSNADILKQIEDSNQRISDIVKVIMEIASKTKVINDIVFQTKLLSFNASVEAARAGEHGKGFAVVAEEVGNLAQMSGNASKEIADMLNTSIERVQGIVAETKSKVEGLVSTGKKKVEAGTVIAQRCRDILMEIAKNVTDVTSMTSEINEAAKEQARGVNEITEAMTRLDTVTQRNTEASQAMATHAGKLSSEAGALKEVMVVLTREVHGTSTEGMVVNHAPQYAASEANVVPFRQPTPAREVGGGHRGAAPLRRAAGGMDIPSEEDPRFKE